MRETTIKIKIQNPKNTIILSSLIIFLSGLVTGMAIEKIITAKRKR